MWFEYFLMCFNKKQQKQCQLFEKYEISHKEAFMCNITTHASCTCRRIACITVAEHVKYAMCTFKCVIHTTGKMAKYTQEIHIVYMCGSWRI